MQPKAHNSKGSLKAVIREDECIGCMKCIQACPADAILGSSGLMHTVIEDECIGCKLCVAPCPVDCIDMVSVGSEMDKMTRKERADHFKMRYQIRERRLKKRESIELGAGQLVDEKKAYILAALARVKGKKI